MSSPTQSMIVSGVPYLVTTVGGKPPVTLSEFAGEVTVQLHGPTGAHTISGSGEHEDQDTVRLHEKDHEGTGKDVRVWTVSPGMDRLGFVAAG